MTDLTFWGYKCNIPTKGGVRMANQRKAGTKVISLPLGLELRRQLEAAREVGEDTTRLLRRLLVRGLAPPAPAEPDMYDVIAWLEAHPRQVAAHKPLKEAVDAWLRSGR